jgi:uncharacterized protein
MAAITGKHMTGSEPYHESEVALQQRTGRRSLAEALAPRIWREIPPEVQEFVGALPFAVAGSLDKDGRPWASIVSGRPGFLAPDKATIRLATNPIADDPLSETFAHGGDLGLIAIDFRKRRRFRINGRLTPQEDGALLSVSQCYKNCPQYIHGREATFRQDIAEAPAISRRMTGFDDDAVRIISLADTFFIATHASGRCESDYRLGADVSHRGGNPSFVSIGPGCRISFPDYIGNFMFNTLVNLSRYPKCGLLFIDFNSASTLQITGTVDIDWDLARATESPGAQRMLDVNVDEMILTENAHRLSWAFVEPARDLRRYAPNRSSRPPAAADTQVEPSKDGFRPVIVSRVVDEADQIRSFYLRPKAGSLTSFAPGQYVSIRLPDSDTLPPLVRNYSISNFGTSPEEYRIGVKRSSEPSSRSGSNWLHDHAIEGIELQISAPQGSFTLTPEGERPIGLISVGSGVTPVLSMLHSIVASNSKRPVWFVHGARHSAEQAYASEVRRLSDRMASVTAHFRFSQPRDIDVLGRDHDSVGRIDAELLVDLVPREADFYLCGPLEFMKETEQGLIARGVKPEQIRTELFQVARRSGEVTGLVGATILFSESGTEMTWQGEHESLLDLAEASGLTPAYSCRNGSCGTCEHVLTAGEVSYFVQPTYAVEEGRCLLCCSTPASNLIVGPPIQDL